MLINNIQTFNNIVKQSRLLIENMKIYNRGFPSIKHYEGTLGDHFSENTFDFIRILESSNLGEKVSVLSKMLDHGIFVYSRLSSKEFQYIYNLLKSSQFIDVFITQVFNSGCLGNILNEIDFFNHEDYWFNITSLRKILWSITIDPMSDIFEKALVLNNSMSIDLFEKNIKRYVNGYFIYSSISPKNPLYSKYNISTFLVDKIKHIQFSEIITLKKEDCSYLKTVESLYTPTSMCQPFHENVTNVIKKLIGSGTTMSNLYSQIHSIEDIYDKSLAINFYIFANYLFATRHDIDLKEII